MHREYALGDGFVEVVVEVVVEVMGFSLYGFVHEWRTRDEMVL